MAAERMKHKSGPWKVAFDNSYSVKYMRLNDDSKSYPIFAPAYLTEKQALSFLEMQIEMIRWLLR